MTTFVGFASILVIFDHFSPLWTHANSTYAIFLTQPMVSFESARQAGSFDTKINPYFEKKISPFEG